MDHNLDKHIDDLYEPYEDNLEELLRSKNSKDIKKYRIKTIKAGKMLLSKIYPIWNTSRKTQKDILKSRREYNPALQWKYNQKKIQEKIILMSNANFTGNDIWGTVGYEKGKAPKTYEEAKKNIINFIRRLQYYADKQGWPKLKYIYVTEGVPGEKGKRIHHHLIVNFPDRDVFESKWNMGRRPQARRLQPDDYGIEGLARYITKEMNQKNTDSSKPKSYGYSLNLHKPWEHAVTADYKVTRKKAEGLMQGSVDARAYFENIYKGYQFKDMKKHISDYTSGYYFKTRMRIQRE